MAKEPYKDPRPGLPLSPLMQRGLSARGVVCRAVADVTEIRKLVTEIPAVTKKKRGRPQPNP